MNEKCRIESTVISDMSGFDNSDSPLDIFNNHKCPGQERHTPLDLALVKPCLESCFPSWVSPEKSISGRLEVTLRRATRVTGVLGPGHQEQG